MRINIGFVMCVAVLVVGFVAWSSDYAPRVSNCEIFCPEGQRPSGMEPFCECVPIREPVKPTPAEPQKPRKPVEPCPVPR